MDSSCIFCRIAAGELPATFVLQNETVVAFRDLNARAPTHILVIPREHVAGLLDLAGASPTWDALIEAVRQIAVAERLDGGFRVVVNQGEDGGQTVPHLHLHLLGGRAMTWPPG